MQALAKVKQPTTSAGSVKGISTNLNTAMGKEEGLAVTL
jgi:hypothetical protein